MSATTSTSSSVTSKIALAAVWLLSLTCCNGSAGTIDTSGESPEDSIPLFAQALLEAYPESIVGYADDSLVFSDGSRMAYDDGTRRTWQAMFDSCDIEDMSLWVYTDSVIPFHDPGRIRCEALFKKMYGASSQEVRSHTRSVTWCPGVIGTQYPVTTVNHVADQLQKVSDELARHPEWKPYLQCSGTFNWRVVAGTHRLSPHSFAIAIDIGVPKANYWRWDNRGADETDTIRYRNAMLKEIVAIFERHGFIWGGYWYHYDTMHFEYRPELLRYRQLLSHAYSAIK